MWLYWVWEAKKWISMPPPTPPKLLPRFCLLCARKQLPMTGNEFCTSVKPFLWIKPAIGFKSAFYSNRGDWLYSWRCFQCSEGWEEEGREKKWRVYIVDWFISFYLHIVLGKVSQGVIWWILVQASLQQQEYASKKRVDQGFGPKASTEAHTQEQECSSLYGDKHGTPKCITACIHYL